MQETKEVIKQVKKIEITTKHLVDGLISGNYHSIFKGQGLEICPQIARKTPEVLVNMVPPSLLQLIHLRFNC